jgi:hypothetical protein
MSKTQTKRLGDLVMEDALRPVSERDTFPADEPAAVRVVSAPKPDMINSPPHYITEAGIEAIDVMERYGLGLHLGTAMAYLLRAGKKGDLLEDLRKARWWINRWIEAHQDGHWWAETIHRIRRAIRKLTFERGGKPERTPPGEEWQLPHVIVDAFNLAGPRRQAVLRLLNGVADAPATSAAGALHWLEQAIAEAEAERA